MTPEHWQQVDQLLEQALEQDPEQRGSFLKEACKGDDALRREVESLLLAQVAHFLNFKTCDERRRRKRSLEVLSIRTVCFPSTSIASLLGQ